MTVHALVYAAWVTSVLFALPSQNAFLFINFSSDSPCLGLYHLDNVCFICSLSTIPCIYIYIYISAVTVRALVHAAWITSVLITILSPITCLFVNFSSDSTCLGLCRLGNVCFICPPVSKGISFINFSSDSTCLGCCCFIYHSVSSRNSFLSISAVTVRALVYSACIMSVLFAILHVSLIPLFLSISAVTIRALVNAN